MHECEFGVCYDFGKWQYVQAVKSGDVCALYPEFVMILMAFFC